MTDSRGAWLHRSEEDWGQAGAGWVESGYNDGGRQPGGGERRTARTP